MGRFSKTIQRPLGSDEGPSLIKFRLQLRPLQPPAASVKLSTFKGRQLSSGGERSRATSASRGTSVDRSRGISGSGNSLSDWVQSLDSPTYRKHVYRRTFTKPRSEASIMTRVAATSKMRFYSPEQSSDEGN